MNIKKNSIWMLSLVFGVSVILYILDSPIPQIKTVPQQVATPTFSESMVISPQPTAIISTKRSMSATADYQVKRFDESIEVSVKLENSTVTDLTIVHTPVNGSSRFYHSVFDGEIRSQVIGKDIKDIRITKIAGASFTTNAFAQAIGKIQASL